MCKIPIKNAQNKKKITLIKTTSSLAPLKIEYLYIHLLNFNFQVLKSKITTIKS